MCVCVRAREKTLEMVPQWSMVTTAGVLEHVELPISKTNNLLRKGLFNKENCHVNTPLKFRIYVF